MSITSQFKVDIFSSHLGFSRNYHDKNLHVYTKKKKKLTNISKAANELKSEQLSQKWAPLEK